MSKQIHQDQTPIEVGSYVRWDGQMDDGSNCNRWAEGEVIAFKDQKVQVRLSKSSDEWFSAAPYFTGPVLRRIPRPTAAQVPLDPLDVKYDGLTLRQLLDCRTLADQEGCRITLTPTQRAVVSAHWSAELRVKVTASAERERVMVDLQDEP